MKQKTIQCVQLNDILYKYLICMMQKKKKHKNLKTMYFMVYTNYKYNVLAKVYTN